MAQVAFPNPSDAKPADGDLNIDLRYKTLVEQIPAVVFHAPLDFGIGSSGVGKCYISSYVQSVLGYTQQEWLGDPLRWYQRIHPDDRLRWSQDAAKLFTAGEPLRATYRVLARDGSVVWFQCQAKMVWRANGRPWFIHGVGYDITDLKHTEIELREAKERAEAEQPRQERIPGEHEP